MITTAALNGRGYRTIIIRRGESDGIDDYLMTLPCEDSPTLYQAMNCHHAFLLTIVNREQVKEIYEIL
jgi:hypothetical protein